MMMPRALPFPFPGLVLPEQADTPSHHHPHIPSLLSSLAPQSEVETDVPVCAWASRWLGPFSQSWLQDPLSNGPVLATCGLRF